MADGIRNPSSAASVASSSCTLLAVFAAIETEPESHSTGGPAGPDGGQGHRRQHLNSDDRHWLAAEGELHQRDRPASTWSATRNSTARAFARHRQESHAGCVLRAAG